MFSILALATTATTPLDTPAMLPCDGVRLIEASTSDRPVAFSALRKQEMVPSMVRNSAGERVQRMVPVTVVKPINGFARCRFVYNSQIDLACYTGTTLPRAQTETVASTLAGTAEAIGH